LDSIFDLDRHHRHHEGGRMNRHTRRALAAGLAAGGLIVPTPTLWMPSKPIIKPELNWQNAASKALVPGFCIPMVRPAAATSATIAFGASAISTTNLTANQSYTFSSHAIGAAPDGSTTFARHVVVFVLVNYSSTVEALTSVTVAGQSTTLVVNAETTANETVRIYITDAQVTSGTTASIVVTVAGSSTTVCGGIATYALYDLVSTTATDTAIATTGAGTVTLTFDIAAGGVFVAARGTMKNGACTHTWTGTTSPSEQHDELIENDVTSGTFDQYFSSAMGTSVAGITNGTAVCTPSVSVDGSRTCVASFR
jgi:hypothetical protein